MSSATTLASVEERQSIEKADPGPSIGSGTDPSLPERQASNRPSTASIVWGYLNQPVKPSRLVELELVVLTFCTGLQDAISFPDYHCFASNQTGNTVFLMVAVMIPEFNGSVFVTGNIGIALGLFIGSALLTGQVGHRIGPRRRLFLVLCNFVQTALVFAAAAVQYAQYAGGSTVQLGGSGALAVLGLLAAAAGSQVVQSRAFAMPEISTAMATAAWVDLVIDRRLLAPSNRPRDRRVLFLTSLVLGSLFGALVYRRVGSAAAIAASGAGKLLVTIMMLFNPGERKEVDKAGQEEAGRREDAVDAGAGVGAGAEISSEATALESGSGLGI